MGTQLPSLSGDGSVSFASPEDFEATWSTFISRGALPVRPERPLAPLETLRITLRAPGLTTTVELRVEVVQLAPERALLRLVEPAPAKPTLDPAASGEAKVKIEPLPIAVTSRGDDVIVADLDPPDPNAMPPPWMSSDRVESAAVRTGKLNITGLVDGVPELDAPDAGSTSTRLGPGVTVELEPMANSGEFATLEPRSSEGAPSPPPVDAPIFTPLDAPIFTPADAPIFAPIVTPITALNATVSPTPQLVSPMPTTTMAPQQSFVPAMMPPWFTGDALRFQSNEDFKAAREDLLGVGAVLTIVDGQVPVKVVEVKLAVASKETRARVKVSLSAAAPGTAVVQATEKNGFKALVEELEHVTGVFLRPEIFSTSTPASAATAGSAPPPAAPSNASATGVVPTAIEDVTAPADRTPGPGIPGPRAFTLPRQGTVTNPTTPEGILAMPLARAPNDADLETPSMPLLLRWLRTTRGVMKLEVTAADHPSFTAVFVDGREVRTAASLATLGRSLALAKMTYAITDLGRPPQMTTSSRTLHLIGEVVRALTLACPIDDLVRAFPAKPGLCARAITDVVNGFGLPPQHSRFIKSDVQGTQFIDEIARGAVGGRTVWETMYLLEVYNGLAWDQPPENKKQSTGGTLKRTTTGLFEKPALPTESEEWAPFEGKDHFQVLGLHWSSSPGEVGPAYQKLRAEYGAGGIKRPTSAATAERIMKRLEEAFKVLNDSNARRAYRREKYNLVWAHQAQLLVQKAKLALYRKDFVETQNILLAAEDMSPSEEAKALLSALNKKTQQQS